MTARLYGHDGPRCPDCGKDRGTKVCCKAEAARLRAIMLNRFLAFKAKARECGS